MTPITVTLFVVVIGISVGNMCTGVVSVIKGYPINGAQITTMSLATLLTMVFFALTHP